MSNWENDVMKKMILALIVSLSFTSCHDDEEEKTLDVEKFTLQTPTTWSVNEVQGYDSFVREIIINEQEKISVDFGMHSNKLNVDNSTHKIVFKTIDNRDAKIVAPKDLQLGTTGIYFDSVNVEKVKLTMSGIDLSKKNQRLFLNALETIKFK